MCHLYNLATDFQWVRQMIEMRLMELQADEERMQLRNYLSGLVHKKTTFQLQEERKWLKRKLAVVLAIGISLIVWGLCQMTSDQVSFDREFLGFIALLFGVFTGFVGGIIFGSGLDDLSEPSEACMRRLDMAVAASETVRKLAVHLQWYSNGINTKALANELFLMAKNESAGSYTRLWADMEDRSDSDNGEPKSEGV